MSEGKSRPHTAAPGEGESVWVVGDSITLRLTSEDTGGAISLLEGTIPPGGVGRAPRTAPPGRVLLRAGRGVRVLGRRRHRPGGRGLVRPRAQCHPAHVQKRRDLAQQAFGAPPQSEGLGPRGDVIRAPGTIGASKPKGLRIPCGGGSGLRVLPRIRLPRTTVNNSVLQCG